MKLLEILNELQRRLQTIKGGTDFTHSVSGIYRGKRQFDENELPAGVLVLNPRTVDTTGSVGRAKITASVTVELYARIEMREAEEVAIELLADIQKAVETADYDLNGLLQGHLAFLGDSIIYPDESGETVGVRVEYAIPHIRFYGNPNN